MSDQTAAGPVSLDGADAGDIAILVGVVLPGRSQYTFAVELPTGQKIYITHEFDQPSGVTVLRPKGADPEAKRTPVVEKHTPIDDDGVTYCGWTTEAGTFDGCGHVWPCPTVQSAPAVSTPGQEGRA